MSTSLPGPLPGPGGARVELPPGEGVVPEEMVARTERRWFWIVTSVLGVIVAVIIVTGATQGLHPPSNMETIDPATVYQAKEFSESNLGTAVAPDGRAVVRMIGQQYSFVPPCVTVPVGTKVTFRLTSADVIHGFLVGGTNINTMVVPGYVAQVTGTFSRPGTYTMPCHEYCGLGHAGMAAEVRAVPPQEMPAPGSVERVRCATQ